MYLITNLSISNEYIKLGESQKKSFPIFNTITNLEKS